MMLSEKKIKFAKSKYGRVEFRFEEGMSNRGDGKDWVEDKVTALLNGEEIGYLKINYIPKAKFNSNYKDILNFLVVQEGAYELGKAMKSGDTKQIIVKMADLIGERHNLDVLAKTNTGTDLQPLDVNWWMNKYSSLMKKLDARYGKEFKKFREYWIDKPMVDYIHVKEEYQKGGIGFGLYIAGAMWMAEKGFPLRSGYSQSEKAANAWDRMKRLGLPVKLVKDAGITRKALDYR